MSLVSFCVAAALLAADPPPPLEAPFTTLSQGVVLNAGAGYGLAGDHLVGELGLASLGLRFERRWLLGWDALVAGRFGYLANAKPYLQFAGAHGKVEGELGTRFGDEAWAGFLGGALGANLEVMAHPGLDLTALDTINNPDGFGGVTASAQARAEGGLSRLWGERSLLLLGLVQEAWRAGGVNRPGTTFTELGLAVRYDVLQRLTASVEVLLGFSPLTRNAALHFTNHTLREELLARLRWKFHSGFWVAGVFSLGRDLDVVRYEPGLTFTTAHSQDLELGFAVGAPLGRQQ